jgi:hypothetical protein
MPTVVYVLQIRLAPGYECAVDWCPFRGDPAYRDVCENCPAYLRAAGRNRFGL